MAMESVLKAYAAYYCHSDICGRKLVQKIENYSHHIDKILKKCSDYLPHENKQECEKLCDELVKLPVGLRYRLDVMDFMDTNEDLYYSTIGSDDWMFSLKDHIVRITKHIGNELSKESRIVSGEELWGEIQRPRYS